MFRLPFGMIWFMVKAPPPRILQVSQWLLTGEECISFRRVLLSSLFFVLKANSTTDVP